MARLPRSAFRRRLARLDAAAFASFVADLWAERGWDTVIDGDTVVATRPETGRRRVLLPVAEPRWRPPAWLSTRSPRPEHAGDVDVDVVVSSGNGTQGRTIASGLDARAIDATDLYDMALYAIDRDAASDLLAAHLDLSATVPEPADGRWIWRPKRTRAVLGLAAVILVAIAVVTAGVLPLPGGQSDQGVQPDVSPATLDPDSFELTRTPTETAARVPATTPTPGLPTLSGPAPRPAVGLGASAWSMFGYDPARTGSNPRIEGPQRIVATLNRSLRYAIISSPAVVGGRAYVAQYDGRLFAFDAVKLAVAWRRFLGGRTTSSPAVANGTVYVGTARAVDRGLPQTNGTGVNLFALSTDDGRIRWSHELVSIVLSSPTVANGTVYVGTQGGVVHAIDAATGRERWNRTVGGALLSSPAVSNGTVYVGSTNERVFAIDAATGSRVWNVTTAGETVSSPAVANGTVYVGSEAGHLLALDAGTGEVEWNRSVGDGILSSPAVARGSVFVGGQNGRFYALETSTGAERWNVSIGRSVISSPAVTRHTVYVGAEVGDISEGTSRGRVIAFDAETGAERWNVTTHGPVIGSPAVIDGAVYIGDTHGRLYLLVGCEQSIAPRLPDEASVTQC